MEKKDFLEDDFLRGLIEKHQLETPSDDFVQKVMMQVSIQPVAERKSIFSYIKSASGFLLLFAFILFFILTSDLPYLNFFSGKIIFSEYILPFFNSIIMPFKVLFNSLKSLTIPLMIVVSAGLFFFLDLFLSSKRAVQE